MQKLIKTTGILVIAALLTLGLTTIQPVSAAETTLTLGHESPRDDVRHLASEEFAEKVEELTDGQVEVEIYSDAALGGWREMQESVEMGTLDINVEVMDTLGRYDQLTELPNLPFVYEDRETVIEIFSGDIGDRLKEEVATTTGFRLLGHMARTPRVLNTSEPIETLEDLEGKQIRVPDTPISIDAMDALGADPTPMAFPEVYTSIETGVIDGHENPYNIIYHNGIHEVAPYVTLSKHQDAIVNFIFWDARFQQLSDDVQDALYEAADHASEFYNEYAANEADNLLEQMEEEGVTIIELDDEEMERWQERVLDAEIGMDNPRIAEYVEEILEYQESN